MTTQENDNEISTFEGTLKRAREGNALSQNLLGIWILNSQLPDGVEVNEDPFELIRLSAEQGFPTAQYNMGVIHETGCLGGKVADAKDEKLAFAWYRKAANRGCAEAMTAVGMCLYKGVGTEPNLHKESSVVSCSWRRSLPRMNAAAIRMRLYIGSVNSHNMNHSATQN